jgi:hypothetical protein
MAIKTVYGTYKCGHCGKEFSDPVKADAHRDSHELIYVPLTMTDLNRLVQFLHTKDEALLTPSLLRTLDRYLRGN